MLFKTLSIIAIATVGLAPLQAKAASGCSLASHYGIGDGYHGQTTANGERYNAYGKSVAHKTLPFGTRLRLLHPVKVLLGFVTREYRDLKTE